MILEKNKNTVEHFWVKFCEGDVEGALALLDDHVNWQCMGIAGDLPISGNQNKQQIADLINMVKTLFVDGLAITTTGWTAERDRVAVEATGYGKKYNGTVYQNNYHFIFELHDDKIVQIREYGDTLNVKRVFFDDV